MQQRADVSPSSQFHSGYVPPTPRRAPKIALGRVGAVGSSPLRGPRPAPAKARENCRASVAAKHTDRSWVADFIFRTRDDPEIWRFAAWRHPHGSGGTPVRDAIRGSPMRSFFASQDLAKQRFNSPRFAVRRRSRLTRWTRIQYTLFIAVQVLPARAARQHLKLDHRAVRRGSCLARGAGVGNTPIIAVEVFVGRTATLATGQWHHPRRAV